MIDVGVEKFHVVDEGYELFANRQLVTVFSAPAYCGEFNNAAALMTVSEDLMCSFQVLKPNQYAPVELVEPSLESVDVGPTTRRSSVITFDERHSIAVYNHLADRQEQGQRAVPYFERPDVNSMGLVDDTLVRFDDLASATPPPPPPRPEEPTSE